MLVRAAPSHILDDDDPRPCPRPHDGDSQPLELIHASQTDGGPYRFFDPKVSQSPLDRQYFTVCDFYEDYPYIPFHPKCLEIATRVVDSKRIIGAQSSSAGATSPGKLYEIYRERGLAQYGHRTPWPNEPPYIILHEPHDFYGATEGHGDWVWNIHEPKLMVSTHKNRAFVSLAEFLQQYEACPFPLAGITEEILSYLNPLPDDEAARHISGIPEPSNRLPPELVDEIDARIYPFENPPLASTRILLQSTWRDLLFYGTILPWLWDLDPSVLNTRRSDNVPAYDVDGAWDWECLVRQLAQVDIFLDGNMMANVQLGLRNRRRIWRLIDEARMGDSEVLRKRRDDLPRWAR